MITHDEARKIIELSFDEHIFLLNHKGISTNLIIKWKNEITNYITQNEQHDKDLARYFELSRNPYENINTNDARPYIEWSMELNALEQKILSKVGKEE